MEFVSHSTRSILAFLSRANVPGPWLGFCADLSLPHPPPILDSDQLSRIKQSIDRSVYFCCHRLTELDILHADIVFVECCRRPGAGEGANSIKVGRCPLPMFGVSDRSNAIWGTDQTVRLAPESPNLVFLHFLS